MWSSFVNVEGRPGLGSSPTDILPSLKRFNHSQHCVRPIYSSRMLAKQLKYLCKSFIKFAATFQTQTLFFKLFHCHFVTNPTNSLCTCSVQWLWLDTNVHSETGQMAVCCQNLKLGALSCRK